jgi:hypothetical protein
MTGEEKMEFLVAVPASPRLSQGRYEKKGIMSQGRCNHFCMFSAEGRSPLNDKKPNNFNG